LETMPIDIKIRKLGANLAVVELIGDCDLYTTPKAKQAIVELIEQGYVFLAVVLEKTAYMDSTALGMLVGSLKRVREHKGDLALVAPQPRVQRLLDITRLTTVFDVSATEESAIESLRQRGAKVP